MEKIKRLINCVIWNTKCNLECPYCYIGQMGAHVQESSKSEHSVEEIRRALSYQRLGGRCHMNICARGETLLYEDIVPLVDALLSEGHVCSVVTNGIAGHVLKQFFQLDEGKKARLFIKISYHYLQLKEKNLLPLFWHNVQMVKASGISFTIELTVNDESVPYTEDIRKDCEKNMGVTCHVIESRKQDRNKFPRLTNLPVEEHQRIWGQFESELFNFQQIPWGEPRREFCYAGDWVLSVNLKTGNVSPCFNGGNYQDNIYKNIEEPLHFCAIGKCQWEHCYSAYVLLTHGAIPGFLAPTYADIRNRVFPDGTEMLGSTAKELFSGRLCQANEEYPLGKRLITKYIIGQIYHNDDNTGKDELIASVAGYFKNHGIRKVAIYGAGNLGQGLLKLLCHIKDVEAVHFFDKRYEKLKREIPCLSVERITEPMDVDAIIVAVFDGMQGLCSTLQKLTDVRVIPMSDLYSENREGPHEK